MTRRCPECGFENDATSDFCAAPGCDGYLRPDPTRMVRAIDASAPPPGPDPPVTRQSDRPTTPVPPEPATLTAPARPSSRPSAVLAYRLPDDESYRTDTLTLPVAPGDSAVVMVLIRNQSAIVDDYSFDVVVVDDRGRGVLSLPKGWWTAPAKPVNLFPLKDGAAGYEEVIELRLHPPREPEAQAGIWNLLIVARSGVRDTTAATLPLTLDIAPYRDLQADITPERAGGRRRGVFAVSVRNDGNAPESVALAGEDQDAALGYRFAMPRLDLSAGEAEPVRTTVHPPKAMWLGRPVDRPFAILARPLDSEEPLRVQGMLRQKPWIPRWVPPVVPVLAVVALVASMITRVPELRGMSRTAATRAIKKRGLKVGQVRSVVNARIKPAGTVFAQDPAAGKRVRKGTAVDVTVALGLPARIPRVTGALLADAQERLVDKGFQLGQILPASTDPQHERVQRTVPPAGQRRPKGTAVTVYIVREKPRGRAGGVPAGLVGLSATAAIAKLDAAGLPSKQVPAFSETVPAGKVVNQTPPAGKPVAAGESVNLVVSAGYPRIAYDDGRSVIVADGAGVKPAVRISAPPGTANTEPAWSRDRTWVAYRHGTDKESRIWRTQLDSPSGGRPLTDAGHVDKRPAVSPDGKVVAFIRARSDTEQSLCLIRVSPGQHAASCVKSGPAFIGRPTWSPDGRSIVALAADDQKQVEAVRFTSQRPSSPNGDDWHIRSFLTDGVGHGERAADEVGSAALSPAPPARLAFTANWGTSSTDVYQLFVGPLDDGGALADAQPVAGVFGCEVAWRSDGKAVAVSSHAPCSGDIPGEVRVIDLTKPQPRTLPTAGANPAWEPLPPSG
jgi:beta-lactam-binding protein with PASTA domain